MNFTSRDSRELTQGCNVFVPNILGSTARVSCDGEKKRTSKYETLGNLNLEPGSHSKINREFGTKPNILKDTKQNYRLTAYSQ